MAKKGLTRKEREKEQHREEILSVALRLFADRGFHNVSMQEIAAESEFSVGTLYNFFDSKESLFSALLNSCARRIYDIIVPILEAESDEREKISNFIKAHQQIIEDHRPTIKMYLSQNNLSALTFRPDIEPETDALREEIHKKLSDIFKSGVRNGVFMDTDSRIAVLSLSAMLESLVFFIIKNPEQVPAEKGLSAIEEIFFKGTLSQAVR